VSAAATLCLGQNVIDAVNEEALFLPAFSNSSRSPNHENQQTAKNETTGEYLENEIVGEGKHAQTNPAKPNSAILAIPALIRYSGIPLNALGLSPWSTLCRNAAKSNSDNENPAAAPKL